MENSSTASARKYQWGVIAAYEFAGHPRRAILSRHRTHAAAERNSRRIERQHNAIGFTAIVDLDDLNR